MNTAYNQKFRSSTQVKEREGLKTLVDANVQFILTSYDYTKLMSI